MNQSIAGTNSPLQRRLAGRREQDVSFSAERSDAPLVQMGPADPNDHGFSSHEGSENSRFDHEGSSQRH